MKPCPNAAEGASRFCTECAPRFVPTCEKTVRRRGATYPDRCSRRATFNVPAIPNRRREAHYCAKHAPEWVREALGR